VKAISDQIKSLDFTTKPPRMHLSSVTVDNLKSWSTELSLRKTETDNHTQPLDKRYLDYLWQQQTRSRHVKDAISGLFATGRALLHLEEGDSELAEGVLGETIKFLSDPSVIEPTPRSLVPGLTISPPDYSRQASHALSSMAEERKSSESSRPLHDRSRYHERPSQMPASDQVWRFARSILTEALESRGYPKEGEGGVGNVKDGVSSMQGPDMTENT